LVTATAAHVVSFAKIAPRWPQVDDRAGEDLVQPSARQGISITCDA
jgi:hypothetical protein